MSTTGSVVQHLYVHVPFCARKCEYCAFYSAPGTGEQVQRYVRALERELELVAARLRPRTIFFGGGTPSLLTLAQWHQICRCLERLNLLGAAEWTIECNPATVSPDKARLWRDYGVNRLSLGVQSLDETLLDRLGRVHSRAMVFKTFDLLRRAGFANLNLDLMFAIPGQTMETWQATLREALALGSEHLSCYEVTYEEDTPLYEQMRAGAFDVDEDLADAMYQALCDAAARAGFRQYEVSNFARDLPGAAGRLPHYACQHNVNYWRGGAFLGLGPSAAEFVDGVRTKNWSNTTLYCERLESGRRAIESRDVLTPLQRAGEIAGFGLRMNVGWDFAEFTAVTGFDLRHEWAADLAALVRCGHALQDATSFRLTPRGLRFADAAAERFLR
ncbi:MAG: radical SAM family heme chaperone HemW [Verrucomicrobiae bacterium]|nr:radical SAM family heme chaperone HemW [Verrucomicrobiae bacterium]